MDNYYQNMAIDEERKMNINTISAPSIKDDENKQKRNKKQEATYTAIIVYKLKEQDVTTKQPRAAEQKILEKVIINPPSDCEYLQKALNTLDEEKIKEIEDTIQDCKNQEESLKYIKYYCYGVFDCMLLSLLAMHGCYCCPHFHTIPIACPLML